MYDFENNLKVGRIAEKIVKQLFEEVGYTVFRYGSEHTVQELIEYLRENKIEGETTKFVRHQPDFVVVNNENKAYFVEVKFRNDGRIKKSQMFPYPCCYIVFLNTDFIYAQRLDKISVGAETKFERINTLEPFRDISLGLLEKYEEKVRRKLGKENIVGQTLSNLFTKITKKEIVANRNHNCYVTCD